MSLYDTTASDCEREEMESRREVENETHLVAETTIGDWKITVEECVDDNGNMLERYWEAKCLPDPSTKEHSDDLLGLVEFIVELQRDAGRYQPYLITADLLAQAHTYWKERSRA